MHYLLIHVAEVGYQKPDPLTYAHPDALSAGTLVQVPFGRKSVSGVVVGETTKPLFSIKPVTSVLDSEPLPPSSLQLMDWMLEYYPSGSGALTSAFIPSGLSTAHRPQNSKKVPPVTLPPLTKEQQEVLAAIRSHNKRRFMLFGQTGSGKTRIYQERAAEIIASGRSVMILTPEISLVPQLARTFAAHFGDRVVVLHSGLGKAARNLAWLKVLHSNEPLVIIGTRSALFCPIRNLGLIVVDELHEPAYKQEQAPYYYAPRVAAQLAALHDAELIYGTATPPVSEYYYAEATGTPILTLPALTKEIGEVTKQTVDLREGKLFNRHRYLSDTLLDAVADTLSRHEQALVFLNRRGTARQILCKVCGWQAMCPRCDTPLTYHGDQHQLRCHTCGFHQQPPYACPTCGSDDIVYRSIGTKALSEALQSFFPDARIMRFDTDNSAEEQLSRHYEAVHNGDVDIIIGTQMLGKGLDLPKLSLVGIVNADTGLSMPDFSAAERTYQLLHQAIGRVGRGHRKGRVIVQSFNPEAPLLLMALEQDWPRFYASELEERRQFRFPPFVFLLKLSVARKRAESAESYAAKLRETILALGLPVQVNEPTPAFYERVNGMFQWQLIVKAKNRGHLSEIVSKLPTGDYSYDLDPINLL